MATPLKDIYSLAFYDRLCVALQLVLPDFRKLAFTRKIFTPAFEQMELKARMRHTAVVLHEFMPADFREAAGVIRALISQLRAQGTGEDGLAYMFLPDYIEVYGLEDYDAAIPALEHTTQFVSCEFAVRPFLLRYFKPMMAQMKAWAKHDNYKVRRLASEGCRPRLPWAMAIPALKKDPAPALAVLEILKNDSSDWVRRSVANNLNDIAKDHPDIVLAIAAKWSGISRETDAIIKHGSRTLLKQGHSDILAHYGLDASQVQLSDFLITHPVIRIGDSLEFSFSITNNKDETQKIRLEYAVFYLRQNGSLSKKVFKISEKEYAAAATVRIVRRQKFIPITTRAFYPGAQRLSVIVNGEEKTIADFTLEE